MSFLPDLWLIYINNLLRPQIAKMQIYSDEMMTLMGGAAPTCDLLDSFDLRLQLVMLVGTCNLKHMSLHLWMSFARSNLELATP